MISGRFVVGLALCAALLSTPAAAVGQSPSVEIQITQAVRPLPAAQRAGATVMGYRTAGQLTVIRQGAGEMICLADDPSNENFQVSCYHKSLEPFMARGRELTAQGVEEPERSRIRGEEAESRKLPMPSAPAAFHSLTGTTADDVRPLHTIYVPWATQETTGLSVEPAAPSQPWLMFPGTHRAHIMIIPAPRGGG